MDTPIHRKINILEMHSSLGYAGGQRNMITMAMHLDSALFNVFVVGYMKGGYYEEVLKEKNIPFLISSQEEEILQFIRDHAIDVIHIHRSGHTVPKESNILKEAKKINPQLVIVEKNVFGKYDPVCDSLIDCSCFQSMMHINERYLPASKRDFDFDRMKVLYNMVDEEAFEKYRMTEEEVLSHKQSLGIKEKDFVIGRIGRPHIAKWSDLILDMMPYAIKLVPNLKLVLMGVPASRIKRIKKSGFASRVVILPDTSDQREVHAFYQIIDVLTHTSKIGECNGNTINEAMFWEKPVITHSTPSKDNGQLEQVIHMENGIIANYPQTFARTVAYLSRHRDVLVKMGKEGNKCIKTKNRIDSIIGQLERIITEHAFKRGIVSSEVPQAFNSISYSPNKEEIEKYRKEYRERLDWEFDVLSLGERLRNIMRLPKKIYWKIRDFIEDSYGI